MREVTLLSGTIAPESLVYYLCYVRALMDVGLTSEQLSLRDTVRDILRTESPPDAARQAITDPERWRTLWKTVVDLGWTELATPDADGEFGPVELTLVLEECGAAIAPIPLLPSIGLAAGVLGAAGPSVAPVLADIASGVVATFAAHSPGSRLPGATMKLRQGRLHGRAVAVPNLSLIFVVPVVVSGVSLGLGPSLFSAVLGALAFDGVDGNVLGVRSINEISAAPAGG